MSSNSVLRMRAIARRHAYVLLRSPHRLFDVTLWPLVDVLLFGSLAAFVGTGQSTKYSPIAQARARKAGFAVPEAVVDAVRRVARLEGERRFLDLVAFERPHPALDADDHRRGSEENSTAPW